MPETFRSAERIAAFVFLGDHEHVVYRCGPVHNGPTIRKLLKGYEGYLLLDVAPIDDALFGPDVIRPRDPGTCSP